MAVKVKFQNSKCLVKAFLWWDYDPVPWRLRHLQRRKPKRKLLQRHLRLLRRRWKRNHPAVRSNRSIHFFLWLWHLRNLMWGVVDSRQNLWSMYQTRSRSIWSSLIPHCRNKIIGSLYFYMFFFCLKSCDVGSTFCRQTCVVALGCLRRSWLRGRVDSCWKLTEKNVVVYV